MHSVFLCGYECKVCVSLVYVFGNYMCVCNVCVAMYEGVYIDEYIKPHVPKMVPMYCQICNIINILAICSLKGFLLRSQCLQ